MGSSRFLPLVIAGIVGLFVGWLFGPDVDDVEETVVARVDQLDAKVSELAAPIGAVQGAVQSVDERTTAIATQVQAIGNPGEALTALSAKVDAASAATGEGKAATDGLVAKIDALQAKLDAMAAAPAAGGGAADALASQIGNTGAVLLAGQTAIFGEKRLTVASVGAGNASLGAEGAPPADVAVGASTDLGDGCSVALAGVAGSAAYLAPTGCSTGGQPAEAAAAAPVAPPAEAPAAAPAPAEPAAAPAEAATAANGSEGQPIAIGQSALFGDKRIFLSRIAAEENTAFVFTQGTGRVPVKTDAAADLGDGCMLTLASIEGTTAAFTSSGCGGEAAAAPAAPEAPAAPAQEAAAPAAPEPAAAPAPAPAPAAVETAAAPAPAPTGALGVGQTATYGEKRIFISRVTPEAVFVVVPGSGMQEVASGASADLGDGCSAKLDAISGNTATFTPTGC